MGAARKVRRREENEVEFSRIVAFSDGVFAIAITLLVLTIEVPAHIPNDDLNHALWDQRQAIVAYAISFAVIGRFWIVHHRFFSDVVGFDGRLMALNLFYLSWIVLIPFSTEVLGDHAGDTAAVLLYAVNLIGVIAVGLLMNVDARRAGLARIDPQEVRESHRTALTIGSVFAVSMPVAFVVPDVAPAIWLVMLVEPVSRRVRRG